ncbi:inorganic phosphate transporter [Alkanindiges illinoisensis]|uniref:Phosphate transporter n=1 Tax=Alkanindiges illinoisensis TaxID=197183 RepID=A0A4Y7XCZ9_9GAMM|nr:inorganic phosphate transporter [Alkanindiges illinoisensis]
MPHSKIHAPPHWLFKPFVALVVLSGLIYVAIQLNADLASQNPIPMISFIMLGLALMVALGFEFVNGFHDTANAVATVIYTNAMSPHPAVIWSGFFNFLGVLLSSGAVAYGILALLPVELILNVGTNAGFAMIFALLIAAIIWNMGTWYLGIPASSSHTLIGSIVGVGLMNQLLAPPNIATSSLDWTQVTKVGTALIVSPIIGFTVAALVLLILRKVLKNKPDLFTPPEGDAPPPFWIRVLLILTCTGVSFAHGSNDGQKGMGLIMLILIGIVPLSYSLNRTMDETQAQTFAAISEKSSSLLADTHYISMQDDHARDVVTLYLQHHQQTPELLQAISVLAHEVGSDVARFGSLNNVPHEETRNLRNDMYLNATALKQLSKEGGLKHLNDVDQQMLKAYREQLDKATQFIPIWVKVAVAIALGMGTMVGWKRVVRTVGERIGKQHLTYAQGASAEAVAMTTISVADMFGMPVSTTQVVSSAVAGTMVANKAGLQVKTIKMILSAWLLTLPASIILSGCLYWLFRQFV